MNINQLCYEALFTELYSVKPNHLDYDSITSAQLSILFDDLVSLSLKQSNCVDYTDWNNG